MVQCLVSVTSCEGWEVSTIEGVGSRHAGYHPLQKTLAKHNGTQCGYCSPEIEQSFGSNICRCTGYRPILEAFKTFASDAPEPHDLLDIEDLNICKKNGKICLTSTCSESDWCLVEADDIPQNKEIELKDGRSWFRVLSVKEIFEVLGKNGDDSYMFVAGNTAKGAYPISEYPRVLIDISSVNELKGYHLDQNLVIGAALTLTETMDIFEHLSVTEADFWYLEKLRQHLLKVAHIPVRNIGTIGGNLMTKHQHFNFQSDVFLLLETVVDSSGSRKIFTPEAFLKLNMKGKIIFNILLPPLGQDYKFVSFKIMPRAQNAHAIVNAGYLYKLCSLQTTVLEARIVYGGLSAHFVHAENTEKFLIRKKLFTNETLQAALKVLEQELVVTENLPEPSGLLSLCPGSLVGARYGSGGVTLSSTRPVSNARQIFTTNPTLYPINQPVPKAEALIQCAGEASYTEDLPRLPCEVYGAFVLATAPLGDIHSIDASDALQQPGVIDFYSAKDIPGVNSFIPRIDGYSFADEEVFCEGPVRYNGQVIGVIVAETRRIAENAAKRVLVKYSNIKKPVIDIKKAKKDANRTKMAGEKSGGSKGTEIYKIVKGDETIYQQTHFCMETLMCVTKPTEEGLEAYCATQWLDNTQAAISRLALDPLEVRLRNLDPAYTELREMVERVKNDAQYADRRAAVDKYNAQNRWKKRGLRFSLLRWTPFGSQNIDVNLSVYHDDGTVAITHGAVEMGQGLNTKAIQIAAHVLNIPMEKIEIKGSNTINTPNGPSTGGSLTSNNVGLGVVRACEQLLSRMAPIRASMVDATWEEQVQAAYNANVDLQAHGFVSLADKQKSDVFGVTLAEVEVDVLTGEWELVRVDLLEDAGLSVEGAFIMGLGYWTCEQLVFDPETGEMLTDRTWNYHVPQARDIPQDFRVYFRNKSYSEPQYFGAKAIGEPPTCMSVAVPFAMREAIVAARLDAGLPANSGFRVVGREVSSDVTLLDYLRVGSELRGSKYMCREGGCGACVVAAARAGDALVAVNSCLVSVTSCEGWEVSTIEGVGSRHAGYHPLQKTLAKHNGTQCGYCSPGWVMTMYSLLQGKKKLTMLEIEQSLAGNICRCTGYRPILDAFKTFASDAPKPNSLQDIEDLNICKKNGKACHKVKSGSDWCIVEEQDIKAPQNLEIELKDGKSWFKVNIINDLFKVLQGKGDDSYMLVAGNTAKGVYPIDEYPRILIDISSVDELKGYKIDQNLILGAGSTLTETIDIFESVASSEDYFWYLENLREHLFLVAHPSVRNLGSIAGNLMTKHQHNDFQSDIFVLFETVGAFLTIQTIVTLFLVDHSGNRTTVTPEEFLKIDMRSKIILNILLPPLGRDYKFVSFKIMHRAQNSRAIVNVGFLYKLSDSNNVIEARIVYGGLSAKFVHAEKTETFLVGKKLFTNKNLQAAIKVMEQELVVEANPPEPSVEIDVYTRRVGGSYGEKISRGIQVAVACALVTQKLDRPCRILLPLTTHMKAVGKRLPCCTDYEAAVDISGKVQYCIEKQYMDNGYVVDEPLFLATLDVYNNCYDKLRWSYRVYSVTTDTASNTWCRSPGSLEAIAAVEFIMERIAYELSLDPLEVRLRNLDLLYSSELREMVQRVKNEAQYADRRVSVDKYNQENRWKKRGLRFCLLRWQPFSPIYLDVTMSVYNDDGTVAITHGGIEMGQGINTKAVQIAAFYLGIPAEKIQIKGNNTVIAPNGLISGGSITSTNIGVGIRRCCEQLLLRLAPFKAALLNASWETIVKAAYTAGIDLQTHGFVSYLDLQKADVFGVTLAEVEVDVLTGEWEVLRVDILEDAGLSTSPDIDVGQVSKAF
ncbi:hypothetical protein MSG28_004418 [Choristoneura fumiferana]|uniref:Uncharacterized protein n=1 Tax=Choristoneura fumiferana TaxID=7141 RepID=A0ACC0K6F7_CHOFU|nr:hypothetical protein MSG28_004418 [Choristoneura fumiferana]